MVTDPQELSPDEERKLIAIPRCVVELRVELRWFEEERGCAVERILVPDGGTLIRVARLVREMETGVDVVVKRTRLPDGSLLVRSLTVEREREAKEIKVLLDAGVREGHVVLAGGR